MHFFGEQTGYHSKLMKKKNCTDFTLNFWLNKQRVKLGKPAIYLRLTIGNRRSEIATHQCVEARFWDNKTQSVCGKAEDANEINGKLNIIKADFHKHCNRMQALDHDISFAMLFSACEVGRDSKILSFGSLHEIRKQNNPGAVLKRMFSFVSIEELKLNKNFPDNRFTGHSYIPRMLCIFNWSK
jgi:hypothetical protein